MKGISDLLDSDMEDSRDILDENSILSTSTEGAPPQKNAQPKKSRKRKCVTMPKPKARVAKASPAARKPPAKKTAAAKRKALEERVNEQDPEDEEEADEEIQETQPAKPRGRAPAKTKVTKAPAKQEAISEDEMEVDQTPMVARSSHASSRTAKPAPKVTSKNAGVTKQSKQAPKATVRETQQEVDPVESDTDDAMQHVEQPKPRNVSRRNSRMRHETGFRRRAGSASDTERGDPNLRRKLGDVTRRFENVDLKYRSLKEVGVNEANANMEKLRKQCDVTTQASNELIASLKKELGMQAPTVQDARKLKKQIQSQEVEAVQLRGNNAELSTALSTAQNEIKSLQAKLAAARSSSAGTPARNAKTGASATNMPASSEAIQTAQMKEELYSDLTGLILRSVKRGEDGDTYDCIQTGRNGSKLEPCRSLKDANYFPALHFKLFVDTEDAKNSSFEQTDFLYQPLLDENRDRDMIELMPDYLTEEITFCRQDAAKFYGRVLDTLMKRKADV